MQSNVGKLITYELLILYRPLQKEGLAPLLKRTANAIFNQGGIIRKLDNLGIRDTPFKLRVDGTTYKKASYFLYEFHVPPASLFELKDELKRDVDILRQNIFEKNEPKSFECTLHEELQPPPYRKDVQELMELAKKKQRPRFEYHTGLDYYPFQR